VPLKKRTFEASESQESKPEMNSSLKIDLNSTDGNEHEMCSGKKSEKNEETIKTSDEAKPTTEELEKAMETEHEIDQQGKAKKMRPTLLRTSSDVVTPSPRGLDQRSANSSSASLAAEKPCGADTAKAESTDVSMVEPDGVLQPCTSSLRIVK
jgi:hypothetical protein